MAEDKNVTLCIELLNNKVNRSGYQCDHTSWGAEVVKSVNSSRIKLLYDIHHMQNMEEDVICAIRANQMNDFRRGAPGRKDPKVLVSWFPPFLLISDILILCLVAERRSI